MRQSIRLGRVAGIPVGIHWSVVVIVGLIAAILGTNVLPAIAPGESTLGYWVVAIPGALLFVVALLAHELAHAFVARRVHMQVKSITLWALGGVAELGGDPPSARADLAIAVAGPATSLAAGGLFYGLAVAVGTAGGPLIATGALVWLALMNGLLAVFNLLPGAPLDGGRVLRALLWMRHGDRLRAARTAANAGRFLGLALAGVGAAELLVWHNAGGLWMIVIGVFLTAAASAEGSAELAASVLGDLLVRDVMTPAPDVGAGWMSVSTFVETVALRSTQNVFPVMSFDGSLVGIVNLDMLSRLPDRARPETRLDQIAARVPPSSLVRPDEPARKLLTRQPLPGGVIAVVSDDGRVIGLVTVDGLREVIRRAHLRGRPLDESRA